MLNRVITSITVGSLLYFIISGVAVFNLDNLQPFAPFGVKGIAEVSGVLFFAFTGYARIVTLGEKLKNLKQRFLAPLSLL